MRTKITHIIFCLFAFSAAKSQPFKMDNVVFENVVFEDAGANQLYQEIDKATRFNELIQVLPQYYHDKTMSKADEVAMTILLSYSYYYQDEYYDALVFNRMATKDIGKKITGPLVLANKLLTAMIYQKLDDLLGAEKILQPLTSDKVLTKFQLTVFMADLNFKTSNFHNAYTSYQYAANTAGQISIFDEFNVYYNLSKSAEQLQKGMEFLAYAQMADSVINLRTTDILNNNLEYIIRTQPLDQFVDSLRDVASLNLGIAYRKNGYFLTALELFNTSIDNEKKNGPSSKLGELYLNKGLTLILLEKYAEAGVVLQDALKIFFDQNNNSKISETYNLLAKNNLLKEDYGKVIEQCTESIEYAKQSNDLQNLAAAYLILSETYATNNDFVNSQKYYKLYVSTKESYDKIVTAKSNSYSQKQAETKIILQKVESDIIESEMREIELLNAIMTANQKEQENVFLKQENELREKDLINKQLEKEQIQRNLLLMQEQLENEQLQVKYIEEQNEKERQQAENNDNKNKLELLNIQKEASDKQNQLNSLELTA